MRCLVFTGVGGPEVMEVQERPEPQPGRFEVVIQEAPDRKRVLLVRREVVAVSRLDDVVDE